MSDKQQTDGPQRAVEPRPRRRVSPWLFGGLVLVLLSVLVAQQLWLWTVIPLDTASDTLILYGLSSLNFVAFFVFAFFFLPRCW